MSKFKNIKKSAIENKIVLIPVVVLIIIALIIVLIINFAPSSPKDATDFTYVSPQSENFGEIQMYKTSFPGSPENGGEFDKDHLSTDYNVNDPMYVTFDFNFPSQTKSEARYKIINRDTLDVVKEGQFDMSETGKRPLRILGPNSKLATGRYNFRIVDSQNEIIAEKNFTIY